jgi:branched-chain amino acid transport system substrate-binding protein
MGFFTKKLSICAASLLVALSAIGAQAQNLPPIKIGTSAAQTGPLAGGGKSALLALQMWRDDVNARGGLLGRKVELIAYDDQGTPANAPGIFTKLIDVDKVDLLISPYGTNPTAAVLPIIKQRNLLMIGNFAYNNNHKLKHDKYFQAAPWGGNADAWAGAFIHPGKKLGAKTIAFLAADAEFSQTLAEGARELAKKEGLKVVYDQNYPPTTVDFSSMLRSIKAAKPDLVFVASYPSDSAAIVRAVNELGVGESVKMFGGAMVGLHYPALLESLGPMLNGISNYAHYVPEKTIQFPGVKDFLDRYSVRATKEKIDPLGYYLAPFSYAAGQILERAVTATNSLDHKKLADWIRSNEVKTVVGDIKFGPTGEWATPRVFETQFQGVTAKNLEQFRQPGKQPIIFPEQYKSGELRQPFEKARK